MPGKGKSNRAARKQRKRELDAYLAKQTEASTKASGLSTLPDDALFVIDSGKGARAARAALRRAEGVALYTAPPQYKNTSSVDAKLAVRAKGVLASRRGVKRARTPIAVDAGVGGGGVTAPKRVQHGTYDMWGSAPAAAAAPHAEDILPPSRSMAERQEALASEGQGALPTDVPAVELVAPGASYNPSVDAHQDLLGEETIKHMGLQANEDRVATALLPTMVKELGILPQPGDELSEDDDNLVSHDVGEVEDTPAAPGTTVVTAQKLTRAQLNKRARHQARLDQQAAEAQERKMLRSIDHLDTLQGMQKHRERVTKRNGVVKRTRRAAAKAESRRNPARLRGTTAVQESDLPVQVALSEQLSGSLRTVKATDAATAAAKERFANLHRRRLFQVEPTAKKARRKFKILRNK